MMQIVWGNSSPIHSTDYPAPRLLRNRLKRCKCGQMTFLDLPCRACGSRDLEPAFSWAHRQGRRYVAGNYGKIILYLIVAAVVLWLLWPPLALLSPLTAVVAALASRGMDGPDVGTCYWLFHTPDGTSRRWFGVGQTPMADDKALDALITGYDGDLLRLERMLDDVPDVQHALDVYHAVHSMTEIYHNRRVSMLLMRSLMLLPIVDGMCLDLDLVCCYLYPEDFDDDHRLLTCLYECARFTCLCPGEATTRCLARLCAVRIQRTEAEQHSDWTVEHCATARPLENYFTPEECGMLATIWMQSAVGYRGSDALKRLALWDNDPQNLQLRSTPLDQLPADSSAVADFWFDRFWYNAESEQRSIFLEMVRSNVESEADRELLTLWKNADRGEKAV